MRLHSGVSSPSQEFLDGARRPVDPERTTRAGFARLRALRDDLAARFPDGTEVPIRLAEPEPVT